MAFGETLGKVASSYYDDPQGKDAFRAQAYGSIFDMGYSFRQSRQDQAAMEEIAGLQRSIAEQQLSMAAQSAADEAAYRDRILARISDMDNALKSSMAKLGPRSQVDGADIAANYQTFRGQLMDDYYNTVERVSSQGKASAMRRGMDRSTQFTDEQAQLIAKSTDQLANIDQAAFDAASIGSLVIGTDKSDLHRRLCHPDALMTGEFTVDDLKKKINEFETDKDKFNNAWNHQEKFLSLYCVDKPINNLKKACKIKTS